MKVITSARQGGKTTQMIQELRNEPKAMMVVRSQMVKDYLSRQYPDVARRLYTFGDFPRLSRGIRSPLDPVYIDDADDFLRLHFGNVQLITLTEEDAGAEIVMLIRARLMGTAERADVVERGK